MSAVAPIRLLLDEHYPGWAGAELRRRGIDAVSIQAEYPWLQGASDTAVLRAAVAERRVVVTEDVSTFPAAVIAVPNHVGIIYCRWDVFPRTRPGINHLVAALAALAADPPEGLGQAPVEWWLQPDVRPADA